MKRILHSLWTEPVLAAMVLNGVVAALASEGIISGWLSVVALAATAPILRHYVTPTKDAR
jgi:apolipoprotein N-acyltransferase